MTRVILPNTSGISRHPSGIDLQATTMPDMSKVQVNAPEVSIPNDSSKGSITGYVSAEAKGSREFNDEETRTLTRTPPGAQQATRTLGLRYSSRGGSVRVTFLDGRTVVVRGEGLVDGYPSGTVLVGEEFTGGRGCWGSMNSQWTDVQALPEDYGEDAIPSSTGKFQSRHRKDVALNCTGLIEGSTLFYKPLGVHITAPGTLPMLEVEPWEKLLPGTIVFRGGAAHDVDEFTGFVNVNGLVSVVEFIHCFSLNPGLHMTLHSNEGPINIAPGHPALDNFPVYSTFSEAAKHSDLVEEADRLKHNKMLADIIRREATVDKEEVRMKERETRCAEMESVEANWKEACVKLKQKEEEFKATQRRRDEEHKQAQAVREAEATQKLTRERELNELASEGLRMRDKYEEVKNDRKMITDNTKAILTLAVAGVGLYTAFG